MLERKNNLSIKIIVWIVSLLQIIFFHTVSADGINKYNVVFVTDASKSMLETDPQNLRFESISQFTNLLSENGNYLGSVVFSTGIENSKELSKVNSQEIKNDINNSINSISPHGFTNIGQGLDSAVDMINDKGDKNLPSVIIFLSDGNSAMSKDEELKESLDKKADAIQKAREKGIKIYSVTLNHNGEADISEMEQISKATGGEFKEVRTAKDLQDVFNTFYNLIYGTSTIPVVDSDIPANGSLETTFKVPKIGVEEVNVLINGSVDSIKLFKPDGSEEKIDPIISKNVTLVKLKEVISGDWKIVTTGIPGNQIKINLVYNPNLDLKVSVSPDKDVINPKDNFGISAQLKDGNKLAQNDQDYEGYKAKFITYDVYGKELDSKDMSVKNGKFYTDYSFNDGNYYYKVLVEGNGLSHNSKKYGPIHVSKKFKTIQELTNKPPKAIKSKVTKTVITLPFVNAKFDLDLNTLAKDKEDKKLHYQVISSSFIPNKDYKVEKNNILKLTHFSLSKGSFDIEAVDSGGLSTHIVVVVKTFNLGWLGLGAIIIIVLGFLYYIYSLSRKSFYGDITIRHYVNFGSYSVQKSNLGRGKLYLSAFSDLKDIDLIVGKTYFQATGKRYIYLILDRPIMNRGTETKKVEIKDSLPEKIILNDNQYIEVIFKSKLKKGK